MNNTTEANFYDLQTIKEHLACRIDEFVLTLFPNAKRENSCYKIGNLQGEKGGSLMISTRSNNPGYYMDFADPSIKGQPWRLVAQVRGMSIKEAIAWTANFCGVPPIQSFGTVTRAKEPELLAKKILPLNQKTIDYFASRGINEETLRKYSVGSDVRNGAVFSYYDEFGKLGMIKHWGLEPTKEGKKETWVAPSMEAVQGLFGKDVCDPENNIQKLVITEGECLSGDTQILTPKGWERLDVYTSTKDPQKVAQWDNGKISWVNPIAMIVTPTKANEWLSFANPQLDLLVTQGHRMIYEDLKGNITERLAKDWPTNAFKIPKVGELDGVGIDLSDDQIRLAIAVSADAAIDPRKNTWRNKCLHSRYARMSFRKERKIKRIRLLLRSCGLNSSDEKIKDEKQSICFPLPQWIPGRLLPWEWIEKATIEQRKLILDELVEWDGNHVPNRRQKEYATKYIENAEWVQTLASTSGIASTIIKRKNAFGEWFKVSILHGKTKASHQNKPKQVKGEDTAYCLTVPSGAMIVRRNGKIVVTGNCDAMACWQVGIPAVSIPMGCSNTQWITEDYQFLSHFDEIVILFDNDEPGKKAAKEAAARLGNERCLIVTLPLKDANDMLRAGRGEEIQTCIDTTTREPIAEIVDPSSMREATRSYMKGEYVLEGEPFFVPDFKLSFRKHETTLWFGGTGEGKSTAVANQIAMMAGRGKLCCVASFEQPPEMTFAQILMMLTAYPNLPFTDEYDLAFDYLSRHVFMYKSMERADPKHLVNTFIHAHKRYGVDTFVVDNVMTLSIDRGDNTAQAEAADLFRVFVSRYPVHLHMVAHPRKPPTDGKGGQAPPPQLSEIRGASEWADMISNIIAVWRDKLKAETLAERESAGYPDKDNNEFFASTPCGKLVVRKQRATGKWPQTAYWFHEQTGRMTPKCGEPSPFYSSKPWQP